jgi:hypothetical protein
MLPMSGFKATGRCYVCNAKHGNEIRRRDRFREKWGVV